MRVEQPRIFLLDGASGAGKSTLALGVSDEREDTVFVRRHTTRARRSAQDDREYEFVTREQFEAVRERQEYLESRDYLFGMSYGIPTTALDAVLEQGRHVLAIVNLGMIAVALERDPRVVPILVDAPLEVLQQRMAGRGAHTEEQIRERTENALTVEKYREFYAHVVRSDGELAESKAQLHRIIDSYSG